MNSLLVSFFLCIVVSECFGLNFKSNYCVHFNVRLGPTLFLRGGQTENYAVPKETNLDLLNKKYAPFYRPPIHRTLASKIALIIGSLTLLPVRLILLSGLLLTSWVSCVILRFGAKMKNGIIVSSNRRKMLRSIIKILSGLALRVCGIEVEESGMPPNTEAPKIVVCNHVSYIDVIWALSKFAPSFVAKGAVSRSESRLMRFVARTKSSHQTILSHTWSPFTKYLAASAAQSPLWATSPPRFSASSFTAPVVRTALRQSLGPSAPQQSRSPHPTQPPSPPQHAKEG